MFQVSRRGFVMVSGALVALALITLALLHARPVRAGVLATIASRLESAGIVAHASRLDYNLVTLTAHLYDVTLATSSAVSQPFFSATEVHAALGWGSLCGDVDVKSIDLVGSHVALRRDAAGRNNWSIAPTGRAANTSPMPIRIGQARASGLVLSWQDAQTDSSAEASASIQLTPSARDTSGPVTLTAPGRIRWRGRETTVAALDGRLSWNGRDLAVQALSLRLAEGTLRADGRLESLLGTSRVDVRLVADGNLAAIAPWTNLDRPIAGAAHADARIVGPLDGPDATVVLTGRDVAVHPLPLMGLDATVHLAGRTADLTSFRARIAGGSITARGRATLDGPGVVRLDWEGVALAVLLREALGSTPRVVPATRLTGSLDARWTLPQLEHVQLTSESRAVSRRADDRVTSADASAPKRSALGSLPLDGAVRVELRGRDWRFWANDLVIEGARVTATLDGTLNTGNLAQSSIRGSMRAAVQDAGALSRALVRAGIVRKALPVRGAAAGEFTAAGTLEAVSLNGPIDATLQYESLPSATVRTVAAITRDEVRLNEIDAHLADSSARGEIRWSIRSDAIAGSLTASASARTLADLSAAVPATLPIDGTLDLSATLAGSLADPRATFTAGSTALDIAGQHVDRLSADATVNGADVTIDRLRIESGAGHLDAHGAVDLADETYTAHVTAQDLPIRPVVGIASNPDIPISARWNGAFDGTGSFQNLGGQGRVSIADARWRTADLGRIGADFTLAGRKASLTLDAPDLALSGSGTVGVDAGGALAWRGQWMPRDIAALAQRLGVTIPFAAGGSAVLHIELSGARDRLTEMRSAVTVDALDVSIVDQPIRLVRPGQLQYDGRTLRVDTLALVSGGSTLTIDGSLGEPSARGLTVALDGSLNDFGFVRDLISPRPAGSDALPSPTGSIRARLTAEGALARPAISGSLQIAGGGVPVTARESVTGIGVTARYDAGLLIVDDATAQFEGATLTASARVPSSVLVDRLPASIRSFIPATNGPATLSAQILSITPSIAAPFADPATLEQIAGRADATIQLEADRVGLDQVRGAIALTRAELSLAGVSLNQQATTRLVVRDGRIAIDTWTWGRDDNRIVLSGGATLGDNPALDVLATAALDLRLLNVLTPAARITGRADAEVRLGGTARLPTLDGYVTVRGGEARVADPRLIVSDVTGTIALTGETLTLGRISATVNGGEATLAGTIRHRWLTPLDGRITLESRGAALDVEGLRAEADASVTWTLEPAGAVVAGTVTLVRSTFQEPLSLTGGLLRALQTSSRAAPPPLVSPLGRTRLDVRIVTQDDLLVDNNYAKLAMRSDLRLVGTAARPSIVGRATLGEGGEVFFGANRYRLADQGTIDFANPLVIDPDLDLRAVTRVGDAEITLALTGTLTTLQTTLTSDVPWYSQSDLVSLLVTGRTSSDAGGSLTPGSEELLGYLSGELLGAAGRVIGLDTLRVGRDAPDLRFDAGLVATETDPGERLTFGKNVGSRTEVVFSQSLQQSGGLTWIVSHTPRAGISLRAVSLDNVDRTYGFRHDVSFGGPPRPARAAAAPPSMVSDVSIVGAGADEGAARSRLKLDRGNRFSFFGWQDDRERVEGSYHERGYFEARVVTERIPAPGDPTRVRLVYDVRPGPRTTLIVDGFSLSPSARRKMQLAWTRAVVDEFLIEEVAGIARADLADAGFVLPSVAAKVERAGAEKRLHVTIDPGRHASDRRVEFVGNRSERSDRLLAVLSERDLTRAVWTEPDRVRDALAAFYQANGYLEATVRIDPVTITGNTATRPVHVDEGVAFRVRTVRVDGVHAIPADEVTRLLGLSAGETFTESRMERAHLALAARYRAQGFNSVSIVDQMETVPKSADVDVAIRVDEGPEQRLHEIVTRGLGRTQPALVKRALKLDVGQPVDLAAWNAARKRLYETGVFRSVDIQREAVAPPATAAAQTQPAEEPVRAIVTVQEWAPVRFRYGIDLHDDLESAGDVARMFAPTSDEQGGGRTFGLGITGDVGFKNLFGRAISTGVAAQYTPDSRAGRVYATTPSLFGLPITSNVFVERSRLEIGTVSLADVTKLTLEQRIRPAARTEVSYGYSLERNHTFDRLPPLDPTVQPFDVLVTVANLTSAIAIDRRNDPIDPTRGWFHSSSLEYAPPGLGLDLRFVRYLLQQRYYRTAGRVVFATFARLGLATAFDQTLILNKRFFAGGGNSVRGYAEDTLSPRDAFGDVAGGKALAVLNQEVRFPIFKLVRGVTFVDAGRAFDEVRHLSLGNLSVGSGFGLRVQTPLVLVRVDFGVPFDRAAGPRHGRWFFSVGQTF